MYIIIDVKANKYGTPKRFETREKTQIICVSIKWDLPTAALCIAWR